MSSFEFDSVDAFTAGAIGPKGQRMFVLQARHGAGQISLKLEKQQVAALADRLEQLVNTLDDPALPAVDSAGELDESAEPLWAVGALAVGVEAPDRVVVLAEELVADDAEEPIEPQTASFRLDAGQATAFVARAREVVAAGRAPCPFCGMPLTPGGEFCPCWN